MFQARLSRLREPIFKALTRIRIQREEAEAPAEQLRHKEEQANVSYSGAGSDEAPKGPVRAEPRVGRNDPCPCGSGRKYKKCCGVNV